MFEPRTYRKFMTASGLETFEVQVEEVNLQIAAERDLSGAALSAIHRIRNILEQFIERHPDFETRLDPYDELDWNWPHEIQAMIRAGRAGGTGPMATLGGCIAEYVGEALLPESEQVVVENGGDVFIASNIVRTLAIYAGEENPHSMRKGVRIRPEHTPMGICTSSSVVGGHLSLGETDASVVLARDALLADAIVTTMGDRVGRREDIGPALDWACSVEGVLGAVVVLGDQFDSKGEAVDIVDL
jgi:hypothetical protein